MERQTALVIDPEHDLSAMLAGVLDPALWSVICAESNDAALELAQTSHFDLILSGTNTSGTEDLELLRRIRRLHPHTRCIILTSETTPGEVLDAIRAGAFSYFSRPLSLPALESMVRSATKAPSWDDGIEITSATSHWIRLRVRCDIRTADRLLQFLHEMVDLPEEEKQSVGVAFRELLMNAIEHGGNFDPGKYVEIAYLRTRRAVSCLIHDPGEGFRLTEIQHSALMNPPDDPIRHQTVREEKNLRPGGFGLLLARHAVDELIYNDKGNEVLLIKYLDAQHDAASTADQAG